MTVASNKQLKKNKNRTLLKFRSEKHGSKEKIQTTLSLKVCPIRPGYVACSGDESATLEKHYPMWHKYYMPYAEFSATPFGKMHTEEAPEPMQKWLDRMNAPRMARNSDPHDVMT